MEEQMKTDRRVVKTKKAIRNAFAELLSEKDIDTITVKDIADAADINRKTFYNYYAGVYQVIDEIENEIIREFERAINEIELDKTMQQPGLIFERLTMIIDNDFEFYSKLFTIKKNRSLMIKMQNVLINLAKKNISRHPQIDENTFNIMIEYTFIGMMGVFLNWFNSDSPQSIDDISAIIGKLCFNGIKGLVKNENN